MRLIAVAVAGLVAFGAGAASAQPLWGPDQGRFYGPERAPPWQRERGWTGSIRPQQVAYIVESMGLDPVGPPLQSGHLIVQRAADDFGRMMRVTIDTNNGRVVSVAPAGAPSPVTGVPPYAAHRPYGPGPYGRPAPEADDDGEFAPPGPVMPPRAGYPANPYPAAPPLTEAPKPAAKSATVTPAHPPQPRKRPENAQAAKKSEPGSVAPLPAAPAPGNAMPPVAPLE